ncbi:MAG: reprolysin-like metallopeptidase, partial [Cyanobacteria bacterium J06649_11]
MGGVPDDPCSQGDPNLLCDGGCEVEMDILVLVTQGADDYINSFTTTENYINLISANSELVGLNSELDVSFDFHYHVIPNLQTDEMNCRAYADEFRQIQFNQDLRAAYGADVVMILAPFGTSWNQSRGCTIVEEVNSPLSYGVLAVENVFNDLLFQHEVGHFFKATHGNVASEQNCCGRGTKIDNSPNGDTNVYTVMRPGGTVIPFYSDPNVFFEGFSTGMEGNSIRNNAGKIRAASCYVADFFDDVDYKPSITVNTMNCLLELFANVADFNLSTISIEWEYSFTGAFNGEEISLGTGNSITLPDPVPDPCVSYFIRVIVSNNSIELIDQTIEIRGGICRDNVQCGGGNQRSIDNSGNLRNSSTNSPE